MAPALTLVLCSRNDAYMGDSRWRLETTINFTAARLGEAGRLDDVEILVTDWGSGVPLREVVQLTADASAITRFVHVAPDVARRLQGDSVFPEVLALNAAIRRAKGTFIGRIDQDTLVGGRFIRHFFSALEGGISLPAPLDRSVWYANRRSIPFRFAERTPPQATVTRLLRALGRSLPIWREPDRPFWTYWVGIVLAHRDRWFEVGGFDERLIHYNWMEVDLVQRLSIDAPIVDVGVVTSTDFYHLEHVPPGARAFRHGRKNADLDWRTTPASRHPNGPDWGLAGETLAQIRPTAPATVLTESSVGVLRSMASVTAALISEARDAIAMPTADVWSRWSRRREVAHAAVRHRALRDWPRILRELWTARRRA